MGGFIMKKILVVLSLLVMLSISGLSATAHASINELPKVFSTYPTSIDHLK